MSKVGIGIVTYNRLDYLQRAVEAVRKHTKSAHELVIADDGSADGTRQWCEEQGIRVISGGNRGVCWNKNRALFALQELGCDPILLLEDDCRPIEDDWDLHWRVGTALFGHLAFAHDKLLPWLISGSGTALDPFVNNKATAQCSSASGVALLDVGFFDTRFRGYGVGHAEWTTRMKRARHGFKEAVDAEGRTVKANLYIKGGLEAEDAPTFKDKDNVARNEDLFDAIKSEPIYRHPWTTADEEADFLAEQKAAGIGGVRYARIKALSENEPARLGLRYLKSYGRIFDRAFEERASFLRSSGWLPSMALSIPINGSEVAPSVTYAMSDLLGDRVKQDHEVFDFGASYSTMWWASRGNKVHVIEQDRQLAASILALCPTAEMSIEPRGENEDLSEAIGRTGKTFDIFVIDGAERGACLRASIPHLSARGIAIVENSDRTDCRGTIDEAKAAGFKELKLRGIGPTSIKVECSSVLYRPENCFDL